MLLIITRLIHKEGSSNLSFPAWEGEDESQDAFFAAACVCTRVIISLMRAHVYDICAGPVFLVQYISVCDSAMSTASLLCPAGIAFGVLVILTGPFSFVVSWL